MPVYEIAGITVEYDCKFDLLKSRSRKYLASECAVPELSLSVTDEYLESRRERFPEASDETLEYMGIGTAFYPFIIFHHTSPPFSSGLYTLSRGLLLEARLAEIGLATPRGFRRHPATIEVSEARFRHSISRVSGFKLSRNTSESVKILRYGC